MKKEAPAIVDSIDHSLLTGGLPSVSDRYYEHRYVRKVQGVEGPVQQRVSFHTNKIVMLSLADDHPVIKGKLGVKKVDFTSDKGIDRTQNAASGKGKRGAQELFPKAVICYVETDDGTRYPVYSCVKGKLLEINEALVTTPQLLVEQPVSDGYIALILPFLKKYVETKESTLTKDDYYAENKNDS